MSAKTQKKTGPTKPIRDRVKKLMRIRAGDLVPNPRNWRTHPPEQRAALHGILGEVGFADALLVRQLPDRRYMLIDGHLRAETTPDDKVPVLLLDVTEAEADKLLAVIDPLAAAAGTDPEKLASLLAEIETDSAALDALLEGLAGAAPVPGEDSPATSGAITLSLQHKIIIDCRDEAHQAELLDRFDQEGIACKAMII